jgi:hypothetical protein
MRVKNGSTQTLINEVNGSSDSNEPGIYQGVFRLLNSAGFVAVLCSLNTTLRLD